MALFVIIISLFVKLNSNSSEILIQDPNFEKALIEAGFDSDRMINGKISSDDILRIDSLYISNKGIKSLSNIDKFTNLKKIICDDNIIEEIDFSRNDSLTYIRIASNKLIKLNVLDLKKLKYLFCSSNNLKEINLSRNINLIQFDGRFNEFKKIDFSKNSKLTYVNLMFRNKIDSLDFSQNKYLEQLFLRSVNLKNIDISNCIDLKVLNIDRNNIQSIDLINCRKLEYLEVGENNLSEINLINNNHLKYFDAHSNRISKFDLTQNTVIEELDLRSNPIVVLKYRRNNELKKLNLNNCGISSLRLKKFPNLERIDIEGNKLNRLNLSKNKNLKEIAIYKNNIRRIKVCDKVKSLGIAYNPIKKINVSDKKELIRFHADFTKLKTLNFENCNYVSYLGCDNISTLKLITLPQKAILDFSLRKDTTAFFFNIPPTHIYSYDNLDKRHIFKKK